MERVRQNIRDSIVVKNDVDGLGSGEHYQFDDIETYSSDVFSKLPFEDLKKAHHETLIPVTNEDYKSRKKFKKVNELKQSIIQDSTKPISMAQSQAYLTNINNKNKDSTIQTAFNLLSKDQITQTRENEWWKKYKQIKNL